LRNDQFTFKASGNLITNPFGGNLQNIHQSNKEKLKDVNMQLVDLGNTRILTDYAQKSSRTLTQTCEGVTSLNVGTLMSGTEDDPNPHRRLCAWSKNFLNFV
jgi:hypothetical protein